VRAATALDVGDRIVYHASTGKLFYDADGSGAGAAVQFGTVVANTNITAADFLVVD